MRKTVSKKIFLWLALALLGVAYYLYDLNIMKKGEIIWLPLYSFSYLAQPLACFGLGGVLCALFCHFSDARPSPLLRKVILLLSSATVILFLILYAASVTSFLPGVPATLKTAELILALVKAPLLFAVPAFLIDLCTSK